MRIAVRRFTNLASALYGALTVLAAASANAAIPIADAPLFLTVTVPPNVTVTLDDSGSMARAYVPDLCGGTVNDCNDLNHRYTKSAYYNPMYYDPNVKYPAPKDANGNDLATSFTKAWINGFDHGLGSRDLSKSYRPTAFLDRPIDDDADEGFMNHFGTDVRCSNDFSNMCQVGDGNASAGKTNWTSGNFACSGDTAEKRNNSCKNKDAFESPAYYYVYDAKRDGCDKKKDTDACYRLVIVQDAEKQNFANWYSFARTRNLATATAAALSFNTLDPAARIAWQALNSCRGGTGTLVTTNCEAAGGKLGFTNAIKPFKGTQRENFYTWLAKLPTANTTPLPDAMRRVGEYYTTGGTVTGPYQDDFSQSKVKETACRRNYHIMMTDGIWNVGLSSSNAVGDVDGNAFDLPDDKTYGATAPYKDTEGKNTLADIALKYWGTDLRKGRNPVELENNLFAITNDRSGDKTKDYWNPRNDPATWQHMVNFTIGLGLTDILKSSGLEYDAKAPGGGTYSGSYAKLKDGSTSWPKASSDGTAANVADLWHAAINSRGLFFSAEDPGALSTAFNAALTAIAGGTGSAASLSANSTSVQPGKTVVYQARFNQDWSGGLIAYPVDNTGVRTDTPLWDASARIPVYSNRKIFSYDGTKGVEFTSCSVLSTTQKDALDRNIAGVTDALCDKRVSWLRGDKTLEIGKEGGGFRQRSGTVMGDIINSDPAYVAAVDYGYGLLPSDAPGQSTYAAFVSDNAANRLPMVYVGANDGRLYGIRADFDVNPPANTATTNPGQYSGSEVFSYIPGAVVPNLNRLTDPAYTHRFYVDGGITASDAYLNKRWKTVLVAGLNAGGKAVYALDVTSPKDFDASKVMWEFDEHTVDGDGKIVESPTLGYTFSQPQIGVLENGTWVAIFGNGYNSKNGGAYLYVLDLETGALLAKIAASDVDGDESNGLSTPLLFDAQNDNKLIDTVYAGDLKGNLWKFDLSGKSAGDWKVAYDGPLFSTRDPDGNPQPITAQPKVAGHPLGGQLVVFGTGRYLTTLDVTDKSKQTLYGIWDNGAPAGTGRGKLVQQTITNQTTTAPIVRTLSNNPVEWDKDERKGWYLDLLTPTSKPPKAEGERVTSTAVLTSDRAIFVTIIPSDDPCNPSGISWLMEANLFTGGTFDKSILDVNKDGKVDENDKNGGEVVGAVQLDGLGISKTPVILDHDPGFDKLLTGTTGRIEVVHNGGGPPPPVGSVKRRSWIQIR
jgi:type IV pilus assembly protein PilY1